MEKKGRVLTLQRYHQWTQGSTRGSNRLSVSHTTHVKTQDAPESSTIFVWHVPGCPQSTGVDFASGRDIAIHDGPKEMARAGLVGRFRGGSYGAGQKIYREPADVSVHNGITQDGPSQIESGHCDGVYHLRTEQTLTKATNLGRTLPPARDPCAGIGYYRNSGLDENSRQYVRTSSRARTALASGANVPSIQQR